MIVFLLTTIVGEGIFLALALAHVVGEACEDGLHVIRECKHSKEVWLVLGAQGVDMNFFLSDLREWLNESWNRSRNSHNSWFGLEKTAIACWWMSKWRNEEVFNKKIWPVEEKLRFLEAALDELARAWCWRIILRIDPHIKYLYTQYRLYGI